MACFQIFVKYEPAFQTRSGRWTDNFAKSVEFAFNFTSFNFNSVPFLGGQLGVETLWDAGQPAVRMIDGVPSHVVRHLTDGTFVSRTAEASDAFLRAARNGWRARLLKTDDVSPEAEAEIAMVVARDLLGRDVDFAIKQTSSSRNRFFFFRLGCCCRRALCHWR